MRDPMVQLIKRDRLRLFPSPLHIILLCRTSLVSFIHFPMYSARQIAVEMFSVTFSWQVTAITNGRGRRGGGNSASVVPEAFRRSSSNHQYYTNHSNAVNDLIKRQAHLLHFMDFTLYQSEQFIRYGVLTREKHLLNWPETKLPLFLD